MKKTYNKPEIAIENFFLAESISGCATAVTLADASMCGNHFDPDEGITEAGVFGVFTDSCDAPVESNAQIRDYCKFSYQSPNAFPS